MAGILWKGALSGWINLNIFNTDFCNYRDYTKLFITCSFSHSHCLHRPLHKVGRIKKATVGSGQGDVSYPLKIEQVLLKGLSGLCLLTLVYNIRILFVPTAFVVFAAVSLPVPQTHPAEICYSKGKSKLHCQAYEKNNISPHPSKWSSYLRGHCTLLTTNALMDHQGCVQIRNKALSSLLSPPLNTFWFCLLTMFAFRTLLEERRKGEGETERRL